MVRWFKVGHWPIVIAETSGAVDVLVGARRRRLECVVWEVMRC